MPKKVLQKICDHFKIGNIQHFESSKLILFEGEVELAYYITETNQGVFYIVGVTGMKWGSEVPFIELSKEFGNIKQLTEIEVDWKENQLEHTDVHVWHNRFSVFKKVD